MNGHVWFAEDLQQTARDAFDLASRLCASCRNIHAMRPYIRLSRGSTGTESESSDLGPIITELLDGGRRRLLIAGALDTGVLATVTRAASGHRADVVVLDICATPLELCRRYAQRWSLNIETICEDLALFEREQDFDIVLIDGTLSHIAEHSRVGTLQRVRRSLRLDGRVVLLFKAGGRAADALVAKNSVDAASQAVVAQLCRLGVALPEPEGAFAARLKAIAPNRLARRHALSSPEEMDALLEASEFAIETRRQIDVDRDHSGKDAASHTPHRYLVVARRERDHSPAERCIQPR